MAGPMTIEEARDGADWGAAPGVRHPGTGADDGAGHAAGPRAGEGARTSLIGYREWRFGDFGLLYPLVGRYLAEPWRPGVNTAVCWQQRPALLPNGAAMIYGPLGDPVPWPHRDGQPAPRRDCWCGLHAWKRPLPASTTYDLVIGAVELWGHVIEHEVGYRAEHARIVAIAGSATTDWRAAADTYHAAYYPRLNALLDEWPVPYDDRSCYT